MQVNQLCDEYGCLCFWEYMYEDIKLCEQHKRDSGIYSKRKRTFSSGFEELSFKEKNKLVTEWVRKRDWPSGVDLRNLRHARCNDLDDVFGLLERVCQLDEIVVVQTDWWQLQIKGVFVNVFPRCGHKGMKVKVNKQIFKASNCVSGEYAIRMLFPEAPSFCAEYLQFVFESDMAEGKLSSWIREMSRVWEYLETYGFFEGWKVAIKAVGVKFVAGEMVLETIHGNMPVKKQEKVNKLGLELITLPRTSTPRTWRPQVPTF